LLFFGRVPSIRSSRGVECTQFGAACVQKG
jgi:hypothetical protein